MSENNELRETTETHAPIIQFAAATIDNKTLITGPLYEIGVLNNNQWGIAKAEVDNVISSIIGNPLKICSGEAAITNEHSCDYFWTNKDDIGKVTAAKQEGDWIHATAEVTDPVAAQKILDGTWPSSWSGFLTHKAAESIGWLPNIKNKSVTIVRHPAYIKAGFKAVPGFPGLVDKEVNTQFNDPTFRNEIEKAAGISTGQAAAGSELKVALFKLNSKFKGEIPLTATTPSERLKEVNERLVKKFKGEV